MKPINQTKFLLEGNCWAACIASILGLNDIPEINISNWWNETLELLKYHSVSPWLVNHENLFTHIPKENRPKIDTYNMTLPCAYYIASGLSPNYKKFEEFGHKDALHAVVGYIGKIVHDPHPDKKGLLDIRDYCFFMSYDRPPKD